MSRHEHTPKFSIVLCSHNGSQRLPRTLQALANVTVTSGAELLLVDNASSDGTFRHFPDTLGVFSIQKLKEPRRGKVYALNTAIDRVRGEIVVFIDDDVRPSSDWLCAYQEAFKDFPSCVLFAGQVRPDWEKRPPNWLKHLTDSGKSYGCTSLALNSASGPAATNVLKGGNFAVRYSALKVRFDHAKYNYAPGLAGGEDTDLARRLVQNHGPLIFVPGACVFHWVSAKEVSLKAVYERYKRIGRVLAQRSLEEGINAGPRRRKLLRRRRQKWAFGILALLFFRLKTASEALVDVAKLSGQVEFLDDAISGEKGRRQH